MQYQLAERFIVDSSSIGNTLGVRATPVEKALADILATTAPRRLSDALPDAVRCFGTTIVSVALEGRPTELEPIPTAIRWLV
jgi:hypothetical protein